jgi:hypothetical protein
MALDPQLVQFRSPGVERLEFDRSVTAAIPAEQIRLVIGFSKKGPFNTPVFIADPSAFKDVYGEIDRSLERKGSYFHRTALAALERGPILALNLLRLNNDTEDVNVDEVEQYNFSASATSLNVGKSEQLYSGFYNKDKFWFPSDKSYINNISTVANTNNKLFNLVNLGPRQLSFIVTKAKPQNTVGFNVTAKQWYGTADIPEYLHENDTISDFMIDVIVLDGNWGPNPDAVTPYERFANDPTYQPYFNTSKGLKRRKISTDFEDTAMDQFLNLPEVKVIGNYTGILIPDFVDLNGRGLFIQDIINSETAKTGVFCAVNKSAFDTGNLLSGIDGGLDLVGHNLEYEQPTTVDFLSYKETIKTDLTYTASVPTVRTIDYSQAVLANSGLNMTITIDKVDDLALYTLLATSTFSVNEISPRVVGAYIQLTDGVNQDKFAAVIEKTITTNTAIIEVAGVQTADFTGTDMLYLLSSDLTFMVDDTETTYIATPAILAAPSSDLYTAVSNGTLTDGDKAVYDDAGTPVVNYLDFQFKTDYFNIIYDNGISNSEGAIIGSVYYLPVVLVEAYQDNGFVSIETSASNFGLADEYYDSAEVLGTVGELIVQTLKGSLNETIPATAGVTNNEVLISNTYASKLKVGYYLVTSIGTLTEPSRLTRITKIVNNSGTLTVTALDPILIRTIDATLTVEVYKPISEWVDYYDIKTLKGFTHNSYHLPNGTVSKQNDILGDTLTNTNLFNALIDLDNITFRYVVDGFGLGIENSSKRVLSYLCKARKNAFGILNAPSYQDFSNSTDPSFLDLSGGVSSRFIKEGGDLTKNPTQVYTLPSIADGASYVGFYAPYLVIRDNGKNIIVPPAGYISNNFIDKYTTSLPWSLVAGARRGVISGRGLVGVETNFTKTDRDNIEPFGLNPIVSQSGTGIVIFGNKTAQQSVKSALSSINVREVIIYIQDGIAAILKNFLFELNTPQVRLEVLTLMNNFMSQVQADGGVYDYRNIVDETNNTPEVIDQNFLLADTYIEPVRGIEIIVHRTTVLKTGQISTGNFL